MFKLDHERHMHRAIALAANAPELPFGASSSTGAAA